MPRMAGAQPRRQRARRACRLPERNFPAAARRNDALRRTRRRRAATQRRLHSRAGSRTRLLRPAVNLLEEHDSASSIARGELPAALVKLHGGDDVRWCGSTRVHASAPAVTRQGGRRAACHACRHNAFATTRCRAQPARVAAGRQAAAPRRGSCARVRCATRAGRRRSAATAPSRGLGQVGVPNRAPARTFLHLVARRALPEHLCELPVQRRRGVAQRRAGRASLGVHRCHAASAPLSAARTPSCARRGGDAARPCAGAAPPAPAAGSAGAAKLLLPTAHRKGAAGAQGGRETRVQVR
jgi:hypothetical protein